MDIDWQTIIETGIGSASGASVVLLISYFFARKKETKANFNEAISIQLDLHQMLGVSLRIKKFNEAEKVKILKKLTAASQGQKEERLWSQFGLINLPIYSGDTQIINSEWMLTQFLTYHRGKTRSIVKSLADAKLSYQILKENVVIRNGIRNEAPNNDILREATVDYLTAIDNAIDDCFQAFRNLYDYIQNEFCRATPVKLSYRSDSTELLEKRFSLSKNEMEMYFDIFTSP